jgi:hypothetical protein
VKASFRICAVLLLAGTSLAHAGDREDILSVLDEYIAHGESADFIAQGELMTDDRAMMYVGGRLNGDNRKVMREQQDYQDRFAAEFPGVRYDIEIRDLEWQTYNGDSAILTFDWFPTRVVPPSLPAEKAAKLGPTKTPMIVAAVFVKQAGAWKIAFTAFVPRDEG